MILSSFLPFFLSFFLIDHSIDLLFLTPQISNENENDNDDRSTPGEIFGDFIEEKKESYRPYRRQIKNMLKV